MASYGSVSSFSEKNSDCIISLISNFIFSLPNQIVKKDEYHKYKVRKIHLKDLPDDAHFELLKMVNPKSSTKCENIPAKKAKVP